MFLFKVYSILDSNNQMDYIINTVQDVLDAAQDLKTHLFSTPFFDDIIHKHSFTDEQRYNTDAATILRILKLLAADIDRSSHMVVQIKRIGK